MGIGKSVEKKIYDHKLLPDDCWRAIISYCGPIDLLRLSFTCRKFRNLTKNFHIKVTLVMSVNLSRISLFLNNVIQKHYHGCPSSCIIKKHSFSLGYIRKMINSRCILLNVKKDYEKETDFKILHDKSLTLYYEMFCRTPFGKCDYIQVDGVRVSVTESEKNPKIIVNYNIGK